jgi:hypothetical protein
MNSATILARSRAEGEIENDAGEEAGFRHPEQETHDVETRLAGDERHGGRDQPPADHNAGDPDPRAEALKRKIARDLEQNVAREEDAGADPED